MSNSNFSKEQFRTFIVIFITGIIIGIILLARYFFEGIIYAFFLFFGITILIYFEKIQRLSRVRSFANYNYIGISPRWIRGIFLGLIAGILFIIFTKINIFGLNITMVTPFVPLSVGGQATVVIFIASLAETIFFTMGILSVLRLFMPLWFAILLKAIIFSSFHYFSYVVLAGNSVSSVLGSFIGAGIYGVVGSILAVYYGSEADISAHVLYNGYNFNLVYNLFSVTG